MAATKVHDDQLRAFLDAGHTQADAARHFGVSEPAIHQRLKRMRKLTTQLVALERAGEVVGEQLTASARLARIQRVIDAELDWAPEAATRPGADRTALRDALLKLTAEVRQQVSLQLTITQTLVDLRVVKEFQATVVEAIREESPATAARIVARLKERRALRASARLPSIDGGESDGVVA